MKITKISISISNLCSDCKYRDTKKCIYDKLKPFEVCGKYKKKKEFEK